MGCCETVSLFSKHNGRMVENFDRKVDREVNRRLRNTKVVYKFNVRTDFVDDTPEKYAQMQEV